MRALSVRQASRCETALNHKCRCRCGGRFHGARRILTPEDRAMFEQLPEDDPHHIVSVAEQKQRARIRRAVLEEIGEIDQPLLWDLL